MMTSLAYNIGLKNDSVFEFQKKHSLEKRQQFASKYNDDLNCLLVCEAHRLYKKQNGDVVTVPNFVMSKEDTVQNVLNVVESKIKIQKHETILLSCENQILRNEEKIRNVYEKHKNKEDQILYIKFCTLEAFGCN